MDKGDTLKEECIISYGSLISGYISNNCIAVGTPVKVLKKALFWKNPF